MHNFDIFVPIYGTIEHVRVLLVARIQLRNPDQLANESRHSRLNYDHGFINKWMLALGKSV